MYQVRFSHIKDTDIELDVALHNPNTIKEDIMEQIAREKLEAQGFNTSDLVFIEVAQ